MPEVTDLHHLSFSFSRGAVDADGRIQPGDMILQMNDISFEHISNSDAVRLLRETVKDAK